MDLLLLNILLHLMGLGLALPPGCVFTSEGECTHTISVPDACNIASGVMYGPGATVNSNILDFVKAIDNKLNLALHHDEHRGSPAATIRLPQKTDYGESKNISMQQLIDQDTAVWGLVRDHLNYKTSRISQLQADHSTLQMLYTETEIESERRLQMIKELYGEIQVIKDEKQDVNRLLSDTQQELTLLRQTNTKLNKRAAHLSKSLQLIKLNRDNYQQKLITSQKFATNLGQLLGHHVELSTTDQFQRWKEIFSILYELASQTFIGQEALTNQLAYLSTENSRLSSAVKEMDELRRLHDACQTEVASVKEEYTKMASKVTALEYKLADAQYDKELLQVLVVSAEDTQTPCVTSVRPSYCSFESSDPSFGEFCWFNRGVPADYNWQVVNGDKLHIQAKYKGLSDHTCSGQGQGRFLYLDLSRLIVGQQARITTTPLISTEGSYCFSFWYNIYYIFNTGKLYIRILMSNKQNSWDDDEVVIWSQNIHLQRRWQFSRFTVPVHITRTGFQIQFVAESNGPGYAALDDISLVQGECG